MDMDQTTSILRSSSPPQGTFHQSLLPIKCFLKAKQKCFLSFKNNQRINIPVNISFRIACLQRHLPLKYVFICPKTDQFIQISKALFLGKGQVWQLLRSHSVKIQQGRRWEHINKLLFPTFFILILEIGKVKKEKSPGLNHLADICVILWIQ